MGNKTSARENPPNISVPIRSLADISPIGFHLYHVEKDHKTAYQRSISRIQKPAEVPIYSIY
jgi:hypothetical protein